MRESRDREAWLSKECPTILLAVVEKQDSESQLPTAKILSLLMCSLPAAARNASSDKLSCNDQSCPAPFSGPVTTFESWTEMLTDRLHLLGPEDLKCNISQTACQCRMCTGPTPNNRVSVPGHSAASWLPAASKLQSKRPIWVFISKTPHTTLTQAKHVANYLSLFSWRTCSTGQGNGVYSCKCSSSLCVHLNYDKCLIYIRQMNRARI